MGATPQHDRILIVDNSGGTPTTLTGVTNLSGPNITPKVGVHNVFGSDWDQTTEGARGGTISGQCRQDPSESSAYRILKAWALAGGKRTVTEQMPDGASGSDQISGEASITSFADDASAAGSGEVATASFALTFDGTITDSTIV